MASFIGHLLAPRSSSQDAVAPSTAGVPLVAASALPNAAEEAGRVEAEIKFSSWRLRHVRKERAFAVSKIWRRKSRPAKIGRPSHQKVNLELI